MQASESIPSFIGTLPETVKHFLRFFPPEKLAPGDLLIKFGGAGDVLLATAEPRPDPRLFLDFHVVPGLFMPNGCMVSSGSLLSTS